MCPKINNIRIYSRIISGPLISFAISRNVCTNKAGSPLASQFPPGPTSVVVLPRVFNQLDHSEYIPKLFEQHIQYCIKLSLSKFQLIKLQQRPTMWGTYLENSESAPSLSADTLGADALHVGLDLCGAGLQGEH